MYAVDNQGFCLQETGAPYDTLYSDAVANADPGEVVMGGGSGTCASHGYTQFGGTQIVDGLTISQYM